MRNLGVIVIGSGKRVVETALPAMMRAGRELEVRRVFARTPKTIEVEGRRFEVAALRDLRVEDLAASELVYLAVGKDAVPAVLNRLSEFELGKLDLLIDTPVVRLKNFRHAAKTRLFRRAWVAEDVVELPWIETLRLLSATRALGEVRAVCFWHSAFAYHAIATAKAIVGEGAPIRAVRRSLAGKVGLRRFEFANGKLAWVVEPRDYSRGRLAVIGERGRLADWAADERGWPPGADDRVTRLELVIEAGRVRGFRAGEVETWLEPEEIELTRGANASSTVISLTESMKRVGFLRLVRRILEDRGGYSIEDGLEDMVIDYHLEKFGRWRNSGWTSPRAKIGRGILETVSRLGG